MKLVHISDLHIGKRIHDFSMIEDQEYILNQILEIIEEEQAEGVIIAGDVYDKAVPSAEAVQLFDGFLTSLAGERIPVYMISGNHDSGERLAFGAELFKNSRIYISGEYEGEVSVIKTEDVYGPLNIYLLPFLKPATVRHALGRDEISTYQQAVETAIGTASVNAQERNVLVAHQFVTGAGRSDSEEVSVGGVDNIDGEVFDEFDYVALGHIHRPQHVKRECVRYSGTPLKYSFSEVGHRKSVTVVELLEKGNVQIKAVPLVPKRDMRKLKGTYMEVTSKEAYTLENRYDYLQITLTDEEDIPGGMEKLRAVYPNIMRLEYDNMRTRENRQIESMPRLEKKSELELFQEFYELLNNEQMKEEQSAFMTELIGKLKE